MSQEPVVFGYWDLFPQTERFSKDSVTGAPPSSPLAAATYVILWEETGSYGLRSFQSTRHRPEPLSRATRETYRAEYGNPHPHHVDHVRLRPRYRYGPGITYRFARALCLAVERYTRAGRVRTLLLSPEVGAP